MAHPPLVLVVEDDATLRRLLAQVLKTEGYRVHEAAEGLEALDALREIRPSAIVLDLQMPGVDGWQFLRSYVHLTGSRLPIVVASADMTPEEATRLHALDVEACLAKPFDVDELLHCLQDALARASRARPRRVRLQPIDHLRDVCAEATRRLDASHALLIRAEDSLGWSRTHILAYYSQRGVALDGSDSLEA